jgi:hypothetical protein
MVGQQFNQEARQPFHSCMPTTRDRGPPTTLADMRAQGVRRCGLSNQR